MLRNLGYLRICGFNHTNPNNDYFLGEYNIYINYDNKLLEYIISSTTPIFKGLNIHHNYYVYGWNPWDYDNDSLTTFCEDCHCERHHNQQIPVFSESHSHLGYAQICDKCGGRGYLPEYHYVQGGVCFKCGGEGVVF